MASGLEQTPSTIDPNVCQDCGRGRHPNLQRSTKRQAEEHLQRQGNWDRTWLHPSESGADQRFGKSHGPEAAEWISVWTHGVPRGRRVAKGVGTVFARRSEIAAYVRRQSPRV